MLPVDPDPDVPDAPVLEPIDPVLPELPEVPKLPEVPDDASPEVPEEPELPEPSVLVLPEGEREVLLLLRPCAFPAFELLDPLLLPVSADDEVSDPEVPAVDPELPWDRSDPCDAESEDDPEPDVDCPEVPEPVLEPVDCARLVPAIASAPAPITVPNQRLSLIRDAPLLASRE